MKHYRVMLFLSMSLLVCGFQQNAWATDCTGTQAEINACVENRLDAIEAKLHHVTATTDPSNNPLIRSKVPACIS